MPLKLYRFSILTAIIVLLLAACAPTSAPATPTSQPTATQAIPVTAPTNTETSPITAPTATDAAQPLAPSPTEEPPAASGSANSITYVLVPERSEANYRVREQLANRDLPNDAVGTTNAISGQVTLLPDGTVDTSNSRFVVDVRTLKTDVSMRDGYVSRNVLQTGQYPEAVFVPTEVIGLPNPLPASGDLTFQVVGDLTIRDVTRPVTWDVQGRIENGEATGKATTNFEFAYFNLVQPQVRSVLSINDNITLEVTLTLVPLIK